MDGNIGPNTRRAISEWQKSKSYSATGKLTAQQTIELVSEGLYRRDNYGWAYLMDDSVGFTVGFPTKLATLEPPRSEQGTWTYVVKGAVFNLVVFTTPSSGACGSMDEYFEALARKSGANFEITYKARKDDWFVVAGRDGQDHFYSRSQCRDQGALVTAIAKIANSQISSIGFCLQHCQIVCP